jgi:TatD DNase family protein
MRGKRNEPAFVAHTASALAKLKDLPAAEVTQATGENALRLFAKARPPITVA